MRIPCAGCTKVDGDVELLALKLDRVGVVLLAVRLVVKVHDDLLDVLVHDRDSGVALLILVLCSMLAQQK